MKTPAFFIACLLTTASFAQQTTNAAQDPSSLGNSFFKALLNEDSNTMSKLLASDFNMTNYDGHTVAGGLHLQGYQRWFCRGRCVDGFEYRNASV